MLKEQKDGKTETGSVSVEADMEDTFGGGMETEPEIVDADWSGYFIMPEDSTRI